MTGLYFGERGVFLTMFSQILTILAPNLDSAGAGNTQQLGSISKYDINYIKGAPAITINPPPQCSS